MANHNQQVAYARAELVEKSVIRPITGGRRDSVRSIGCAVAAAAGTRFVPCVDAGAHVLNDAAANLRAGQGLEEGEGRREV